MNTLEEEMEQDIRDAVNSGNNLYGRSVVKDLLAEIDRLHTEINKLKIILGI